MPVLKDILPQSYYQHWCLFSTALATLVQKSIDPLLLPAAERQLTQFVRETSTRYGDRHIGINVHQLLHLVACVRLWGPLWTISGFAFEHMNGYLLSFFSGKTANPRKAMQAVMMTLQQAVAEADLCKQELHPDVRRAFLQMGGLKLMDVETM